MLLTGLLFGLSGGPLAGLLGGVFFGLIGGLIVEPDIGFGDIKPVGKLSLAQSWHFAKTGLLGVLSDGLRSVLLGVLRFVLPFVLLVVPAFMLIFVLHGVLLGVMIFVLLFLLIDRLVGWRLTGLLAVFHGSLSDGPILGVLLSLIFVMIFVLHSVLLGVLLGVMIFVLLFVLLNGLYAVLLSGLIYSEDIERTENPKSRYQTVAEECDNLHLAFRAGSR